VRWLYLSRSGGEWIGFPGIDQVPYRKLVRAISRVRREAANGVVVDPVELAESLICPSL
jgi:hypothetical protein